MTFLDLYVSCLSFMSILIVKVSLCFKHFVEMSDILVGHVLKAVRNAAVLAVKEHYFAFNVNSRKL